MLAYQFDDWNNSFTPILKQPVLVGIGFLINEPHWVSTTHLHHYLTELVFVKQGHGLVTIDRQVYPISPGSLIIYRPNQLHQEDFSMSNESPYMMHCSFNGFEIAGLADGCLIPPSYCPVLETDQQGKPFETCLHDIFIECHRKDIGYEQIAYSRLETLLLLVLRAFSNANGSFMKDMTSSLIQRVKSYIDEHYFEELKLSDLSAAFYVSAYHLAHLFCEEMGESPIKYLIKQRMAEAERLLSTSNLSIVKISERVGYKDPQHFCHQFKNLMLCTPGAYRNMQKIDDNTAPSPFTLMNPCDEEMSPIDEVLSHARVSY